MENIVIKSELLSKIYFLYSNPLDRLKEALHPRRKLYHREFYALKNVTFDVRRGEVLGVIGKNGSGKSTLLKILAGVLTPSRGDFFVRGKVASLLELGAGFNMEYSGLENIFLQGTLMGYDRNLIETKVDEILDFADIGDFIHQPVKYYSSGMFARLAFAVSVNVDPDILIIDEALSVGDMAFQEKSILKMKSMINDERTILFVSHSLTSIRNFCHRALWLHDGQVRMHDDVHIVCDAYAEFVKDSEQNIPTLKKETIRKDKEQTTIAITDVNISGSEFLTGDDIEITIGMEFHRDILDYAIGVLVYNSLGQLVTLYNTVRDDLLFNKSFSQVTLKIPNNDFLADTYFVSVSISDTNVMFHYDREDYVLSFRIKNKLSIKNIPISEGRFRSKHVWEFGV